MRDRVPPTLGLKNKNTTFVPAGKQPASKTCFPYFKDRLPYLDQALSHLFRGRLYEDAKGGVEVLDGDGSHEASLLLLPKVPMPLSI